MEDKRLTDKRLALPKNTFRQSKSKEEYLELARIASKVDNAEIYNRLAEYEDDEERGKIVRLPCRVGDTVWCISDSQIIALEVKTLIIGDEFELQCFDGANVFRFTLRHFGDWLFFDREKAEKRLRELQGVTKL